MSNTIYIDHTSMSCGAFAVCARETKIICTGLDLSVEHDEPLVTEIFRLCGIHFFLDEAPKVPLYSVPYLCIIATDGQGGWFATTEELTNGPLYHIAPDRTVCLVANYYKNFFDLAISDSDWRGKILPGGPWPRLPEDPEGRRKLAETFRFPTPPPEELHLSETLPQLFASREDAEKTYPIQDFWTVLRENMQPRFQVYPMMSPQDREGRALVHYQAWQETYSSLMPENILESHTLELCRKIANDRSSSSSTNTFVALDRENGDQVVGFGTLSYCAREYVSVPEAGEITALYVLREFQGQGLGKDLLEHCLSWIPRPRVVLFVLKGNDKAIGFYQHMGFQFTGHEVSWNGTTELEMVLEKDATCVYRV